MHTLSPLVTVGIPTYNRPAGLQKTLECIVNQTYANLEIIISDNHSTEAEVLEVIKKFSNADSRIQFYIQPANLSIIPNFQFLMDKANGAFFMWAADDDDWDNNFVETCVAGLQKNADAVACISDVKIITLDGKVTDTALKHGFMQNNLYKRLFHWTRASGEVKYFFCGLYRTALIKNIHFPNQWGGDHMFLIEVITKGKFLYIPNESNFYYYRGGSSTNTERIKKAFNIKSLFFYSYTYVLRYAYYHFGFSHLNLIQKAGLFFSNALGLVFNKEKILYFVLIKKPFMNLKKFILKKRFTRKQKPTYNQDGLTTLHNNGFMKDAAFAKAEQAGADTGSWKNIHWRVHTILWAAANCKNIEGDFVECGTNKGGFAKAVCEYLDFNSTGKTFFLLDTFEGLIETLLTDEEKKAGKKEHFDTVYSDCYEAVTKTFSVYPSVKIIKGTVPDTLEQVTCKNIAFLSIDMNSVVPEVAALNYFWNKLSKGGMIVLDDYAYVTCDLQYAAHNKWAEGKGIKILSLPTGQGLIVK